MKMIRKQKALAIARDALRRLRYRHIAEGKYGYTTLAGATVNLQERYRELEEKCEVCLLGSLVLSLAKLYDNMHAHSEFGQYTQVNLSDYLEPLREVLGNLQYVLLESFFEGYDLSHRKDGLSERELALVRGAALEGSRYSDSRDRVRAALKNFITNDGKLLVAPATTEAYYHDAQVDE